MSGSQCAVCHVPMEKARVHYGGVSCYSCRAFFRRTTQRDELAKCRFQSNCKVDHQERKSCPPCRYDRCLRGGMRPDLVLDEDDKKKRFKKYKTDQTSTQDFSDNETTSWSSSPAGSKRPGEPSSGSKAKKRKVSSPDHDPQPRFYHREEEEDDLSDQEDFLEFIKQTSLNQDINKIYSDLANNESILDPETGQIIQANKDDSELNQDEVIWKYIHKKFRTSKGNPIKADTLTCERKSNNNMIKSVRINNLQEDGSSQCEPGPTTVQQFQRKSVIVRREETPPTKPETVRKTFIEVEFDESTTEEQSPQENPLSIKLCFDLLELENLYEMEENQYFQSSLAQFEGSWRNNPMGEEMMTIYTKFCQEKTVLPLQFMKLIMSTLRSRFLNFVCDQDEMNSLPTDTQFRLLKKAIPECVVMAKVWGFNVKSKEEELSLVFTERDLQQFKETGNGAEGVKINTILKFSPLPQHLKEFLMSHMKDIENNILADRTVFMMIVLLLIFDDPDPSILRIRDQYTHMLRRYLRSRFGDEMTENLMLPIFNCIKVLPQMALPFRQM